MRKSHRHNFGPWRQERREDVQETPTHRYKYEHIYNVRTCLAPNCLYTEECRADERRYF